MDQSVLRVNQVAERLGVSRSTVWNWGNTKSRHYRADFPRPFKVSANVVGWFSSEIDDYIGKLAAKREEQAG
ncbi:TPA: helix-turn-helix transcriptional regulator [Neisseria meningitidis]|uniref:helix-turn-helix transcriptional regulator n=1 Tax=Neisseria meningitidis TaxID=487 RepID=UPI000200DA99|nr:AlpA family phage regulatory protein [Neisseria meningitidis]ADZ00001.1 phage CP4-57 regulatory protein AlpA [Neisseria meningitidis M01-240355]MBG8596112.1 AlpA family phage regulatory protein [Neisseria meningitidis]MBG8638877.1 AlpA family phage regulatory protein [Neisseria meningitidis]MBG8656533.1 AlpA family phage regulatory protein [Neisseria meningitidis]MBG8658793.1 AlpA family phage regulatory protein [Neisseria meningitidis]